MISLFLRGSCYDFTFPPGTLSLLRFSGGDPETRFWGDHANTDERTLCLSQKYLAVSSTQLKRGALITSGHYTESGRQRRDKQGKARTTAEAQAVST